MSPFWRALLVGEVLVALVLLAQRYGRAAGDLASAARRARQSVRGPSDVRGIQWLMAVGASLLGAVVLLAILLIALRAPGSERPTATREAGRGSATRSARETPHPATRVALARGEVRENRQREQQVDQ